MSRNYWLDLFTGTTWEEFKKHGANVSGFRHRRRKLARSIKPGDYLICYLTGVSRFIGVLEVKSDCFEDHTPIWDDAVFPIRFEVELVHELTPATAIPVQSLKDTLSIFQNLTSPNAWTGFFRGSPHMFTQGDGRAIVDAIQNALANPISREYDHAQYYRRPKIFESTSIGVVTVPDEDNEPASFVEPLEPLIEASQITHSEIQYLLLKLGSDMGLDVWVARNDKTRCFAGKAFAEIRSIRRELPRQFDDATNRTIEMIDVLWLQGDAIIAAFEVEHTTSIYSGLLRMADLITMQPNIKINLYLVAPDDKEDKVFNEINRPTFRKLKPPLPKICKFIPYSKLKRELDQLGSRVRYLKPEFVDELAESCEPDEA
jgi:hypothetical protein